MPILSLAWKSLLNRRLTVGLTVLSIALSVMLLLGVERLRHETQAGFAATVSGTDLIVGARTGSVQLLLYSVFRLGEATNNISWDSAQTIAGLSAVAWTIPISLGDSHRGFRVMGTTKAYFDHFHYGDERPLAMADGRAFDGLFEAVIGARVARALGYSVGQEIIIAHGAGEVSFVAHDELPFTIVGILEPTGTPVDQTVHVSLAGIEAIHIGWESGAPQPGATVTKAEAMQQDLTPSAVTALLVGLNSRMQTFFVQRAINTYRGEPLLAILPGLALDQLWRVIGGAHQALLLVSGFVVVVGLFGMVGALVTSVSARRREMAILRAVGAGPRHIFALVVGEASLLTLVGSLLGLALVYLALALAQPIIAAELGLLIEIGPPGGSDLMLLGVVLGAGIVAGLIPGYLAYRQSVADGMTVRL